MPRNKTEYIIRYLARSLSRARFRHTLSSLKVARKLASKYNIPKQKIEFAALLHDAGKGFSKNEMVEYVMKNKVTVPLKELVIKYNPSLLHSYISAHIARNRFGIKDPDILNAIALHTVGSKNMSLLSKIIYLADATTADRRYPGVAKLRWHAKRNIDKAFLIALSNKLMYVLKNRKWIHPQAVEAWNQLIK